MDPIIPFIWTAGVLHLLIASSNFFAARILDYRGNLARVTPIVRDIFWVQKLYIEFVLAAFALVCFLYAADLAGQTALGRFFSGFLALFWGLRFLIQLFFYNVAIRRQHSVIDATFLLAQVYLTGVFTVAAMGWLRELL
jgi:hypothetical protein